MAFDANDSDLDAAVAAGALSAGDAQALRRFVNQRRIAPPPIARDAQFRYVGSAGGLAAAVALIPLCAGLDLLLFTLLGPFVGLPIAASAWWLARRFADRREGAATSILFAIFAVHVALALIALLGAQAKVDTSQGMAIALSCALASFAFWRRFRLPLAYAAGVVATLTIGDHVMIGLVPNAPSWAITGWMLASAAAVFAVAMWWDMTDVYRQTIRSDIAWWLHGVAALKLCAAGARAMVGVRGSADTTGWDTLWSLPAALTPFTATALITLLVAYAVIAVAIDRAALPLVGLIFVVQAMNAVAGAQFAPITLVLAGGLAIVTATRWAALRGWMVARLPLRLRAQLPRTDPGFRSERPVV